MLYHKAYISVITIIVTLLCPLTSPNPDDGRVPTDATNSASVDDDDDDDCPDGPGPDTDDTDRDLWPSCVLFRWMEPVHYTLYTLYTSLEFKCRVLLNAYT